jgi:hypothetical protein
MRKKFFLFLLINFLIPFFVFGALVPCGPGIEEKPVCEFCDLFVLFENIVDFFVQPPKGLIYPIAIFMIVLGGFMFILGYMEEEPKMISQGKSLMRSVAIGLLIILAAWLIVNLFFQIIGVAEWTGLKEWWKINCQ